jgi:hypothetical protein
MLLASPTWVGLRMNILQFSIKKISFLYICKKLKLMVIKNLDLDPDPDPIHQ